MAQTFLDAETNERVSRRELAARRRERAAARQVQPLPSGFEAAQALTNFLRHGSTDGRKVVVSNNTEPARKPPPPPPPPAGSVPCGGDVERAHRLGLVVFDAHGIRDPDFKYGLSTQRPAWSPRTIL
jgi:hypothetical protein